MKDNIKYIDIHGHMNFPDYDSDRDEVIKRAQAAGVAMITVGTDIESSKQAIDLTEKHENMWAVIGVHPVHIAESHHGAAATFDQEEFLKIAQHPKVVAIGECGLDYFHSKPDDIAHQREIFIEHIMLANEVNRPLMLHVRNAKEDKGAGTIKGVTVNSAYQEAVVILKEHAKVKANFHFFAGSLEDAKSILEIDGTMSFTGVITFARNYDEIIKYIPLDRMMSETDCPYVAPSPYRGKRNESSYVTEVVKAIAKIRGEDENVVAMQLLKNARTFFKI